GEQDNAPAGGGNAIAPGRSRIRCRGKHAINLALMCQNVTLRSPPKMKLRTSLRGCLKRVRPNASLVGGGIPYYMELLFRFSYLQRPPAITRPFPARKLWIYIKPAHSGLNLPSDATVKSHRIESSENSIVALFILPAGWTWQPSPSQSMHGGAVIMTHSGISSYGDAEVYLKINFSN